MTGEEILHLDEGRMIEKQLEIMEENMSIFKSFKTSWKLAIKSEINQRNISKRASK